MLVTVDTLDDPRLAAYVSLTDLQLRNRLEPARGLFIAEGRTVITIALERGYEPLSLLMESKWLDAMAPLIAQAEEVFGDVPVFVAPHELITRLTGYEVTRGALGAFRRGLPLAPAEVLDNAESVAVLVGITNAMNVGAIFRNAAALGAGGVLVDGTSVDPLYRRALRSSMGTALTVPFARYREGLGGSTGDFDIVTLCRDQGFQTIALTPRADAVSVADVERAQRPRAIFLGSEGDGLPTAIIERCELAVKIPMACAVDSLNVAAASAIAFWTLIPHAQ